MRLHPHRPWSAPVASVAIVFVCTAVGLARPAVAQTPSWEARGFVNINGGRQVTSTDFSDNVIFTQFVEEGNLDVSYDVDRGTVFDVSGGIRVWRNLAVGVGVSRFSRNDDTSVTAQIPHPFFFDRDRQINGTAADLKRKETAVHVQAMWVVPASDSVVVTLFGGPTYLVVKQDLVTDVLFTQTYPYNAATFTGTNRRNQSDSKIGFNVGADIAFYFSDMIGVGWLARFSRASVDLRSPDGGTVAIDAGGFHTVGGLRVRF